MGVFAYRATLADRKEETGSIIADSPRQARDLLRARGLNVHLVEEQAERSKRQQWNRPVVGRAHSGKLVGMVRELSTLLAVGIPLLEALDTISEQYKGKFRACVLLLRDQVAAGANLADAMRQQPDLFDEMCISITEVGENAGTLEEALENIADFKERHQQMSGKIGTALLYPAIVMTLGLGASIFLMTYVVPNLLQTLTEAGKELPWATRVVKTASDLLMDWWWLLLGGLIGVFIAFHLITHNEAGKCRWHRVVLKLPLIGELVRKQAVSRIAMVISALIRNGVTFDHALRIAQRTTSNRVIRQALKRCESAVCGGRDIGQSLGDSGAFPMAAVKVFSVGQQSGQMEPMLDRLASDYDKQVQTAAQRLTAVLEPILILALAVIVGMIAFATILPILEAGDVL